MKRIFILFVLLFPLAMWAQNYSSKNSKAIKLFEKGQQALYQSRGADAINFFEQALAADPKFIEVNIMLAEWYLDTKNAEGAMQYYYEAVAIDAAFFPEAWLQLGELELKAGNNAKAKENYNNFLRYDRKKKADSQAKAKHGIACADFRMKAMANPVPFNPENMGASINSKDDEYLPTLTADNNTLVFTRRFPRKPTTAQGINEEEDFYVSLRDEKGNWSKSTRMPEPVNSNDNEGAQCISQDGRVMFFTACGRQDGVGRCDLYMCTRKGDQWSKPRNVGQPVNSGAWESQPTFSIDGRTLYFVSDRKGGYGGMDIWKTTFGKSGWSEPENLGPNINTPGNEMSPFIHYDDKTLYFSSDGHPGMGGMDLFCVRRQEDGSWGKPENLGYPINTLSDETNLIVSADARTAYYSSDRKGGYGKQDIYTFELPVPVRPERSLCLSGTVYDQASKQKLSATVSVLSLATGEIISTTTSDPATGHYVISMPAAQDYAIHVSAKGYLFHSQSHEALADQGDVLETVVTDIPLSRIEKGQCIALRNVFFETGKSDILDPSKVELDKVVEILKANPSIKIELGGHTDNVGKPADNQLLSERRAQSVMEYLKSQGIASDRLTYKGYGESKPITTNDTEEGRQQNRRTELKIL